MEFRKREVKKPKQFKRRNVKPPNSKAVIGKKPEAMPPPMMRPDMKNRILVVSVLCEMYEISDLNEIDIVSPYPSLGRSYEQGRRLRHFEYVLPENSREVMREIVNFWNGKTKENDIKRPKYSIRAASIPEEVS